MPRNGAGTYTLPAGNPVVTGTTISSTVQNNTMSDIANALTSSVSADGQTPMTGALNLFTGSTTPTAATGTSTTVIANTAFVQQEITARVAGKNRLINGDFKVAQRGVSGTVSGGYTLDRWLISGTGTLSTWAQNTGTAAAPYPSPNKDTFLVLAGIAGNTALSVVQRIESANGWDLAGGQATLSFWVNQNTGSALTITPNVGYATALDNFTSVTSFYSTPVVIPSGVWTKVTALLSVPTAATTGIQVSINLLSGLTSGQCVFGQAQLESGIIATTFERLQYQQQEALCFRYFRRFTNSLSAIGFTNGVGIPLVNRMRVSPSITHNLVDVQYTNIAPTGTQWSVWMQGVVYATKTGTVLIIVQPDASTSFLSLCNATFSGNTTGLLLGPSAFIDLSAEL